MTDYTSRPGIDAAVPSNVVPGYLGGQASPVESLPFHLFVTSPDKWTPDLTNAIDLGAYVDATYWTASQEYGRQADTAQIWLYDKHDTPNLTFSVAPLSDVTFVDARTGAVIYAGVCDNPQFFWLSPTLARWELNCSGYQNYLAKAFPSGLSVEFGNLIHGPDGNTYGDVGDMVVAILTDYGTAPPPGYDSLFGVKAATVANGGFVYRPSDYGAVPVTLFTAENTTIQDVLNQLSQLASGQTLNTVGTWGWYVDELRNLHFAPQSVINHTVQYIPNTNLLYTDVPKLVTITDTPSNTAVETTAHALSDGNTFTYTWDATDIRNTIHLNGTQAVYQQADTWVGDGSTTQWDLSFVPDFTKSSANYILALTIGGVVTQVQQQGSGPATSDYFIVEAANGSYSLQMGTATSPPGSGVIIELKYNYQASYVTTALANYKLPDNASNNPNPYNGPNQGVFAEFISESSMSDLTTIEAQGDRELGEYGFHQESITFTTTEDFTGHIRAGQLINVSMSQLPDSQTGTVGINDMFLVTSNQITASTTGAGYRTYNATAVRTYMATSARTSTGGQRAYTFADLIGQLNSQSSSTGVAGAQAITQLLVDYTESWSITDTYTISPALNPAWDAGEWGYVLAE